MAMAEPSLSMRKVQALFHFLDSAKSKLENLTECMLNGIRASIAIYALCTVAGFMMWIAMAFLDLAAGTRVLDAPINGMGGLNKHVLPALQLLNGLLALFLGFSIPLGRITLIINVNSNRSTILSQHSKMIRALPKAKYGSLRRRSDELNRNCSSSYSCAICLGCIGEEDGVRILPNCRHYFHISCIDRWLFPSTVNNSSCPLCRATVITLNSSQAE